MSPKNAYNFFCTSIDRFPRNITQLPWNAQINICTHQTQTKRLFIMKKLYSLRVARPIITRCYLTFIESVFLYHICTLFGHLSKTCLSEFDHVIHVAGSMAHYDFPPISAIYVRCFKQRCLRMYASERTPLFELEKLPSGRYRQLKCRINLRKYCFRNMCIKFLNSIF